MRSAFPHRERVVEDEESLYLINQISKVKSSLVFCTMLVL